jgi:hypothetical protein
MISNCGMKIVDFIKEYDPTLNPKILFSPHIHFVKICCNLYLLKITEMENMYVKRPSPSPRSGFP